MARLSGRGWRGQDSFERRYCWIEGRLFLAFLARGRHCIVMWLSSFSVKEGVKPEKRGFQPMRKKLGEKFGVVFSFSVVVTGTELFKVIEGHLGQLQNAETTPKFAQTHPNKRSLYHPQIISILLEFSAAGSGRRPLPTVQFSCEATEWLTR